MYVYFTEFLWKIKCLCVAGNRKSTPRSSKLENRICIEVAAVSIALTENVRI